MKKFIALGKSPEKLSDHTIYLRHGHFRQALLEAAYYIEKFGGVRVMRPADQFELWCMLKASAGKE